MDHIIIDVAVKSSWDRVDTAAKKRTAESEKKGK